MDVCFFIGKNLTPKVAILFIILYNYYDVKC